MQHDTQFLELVNAALAAAFADNEASFSLNETGVVTIGFEGGVDVTLQADVQTHTLLAWSEICCAGEAENGVILRALKMNFFALSPTGAFIAYDQASSALQLCYKTCERVLHPGGVDTFLGQLVAGVGEVRRALQAGEDAPAATPWDEMGAMRIRG